MNKNLQMVRVLRILFIIVVFILGMMMWNQLPEQIVLHFNSAMEPDEFGDKKQILAVFFLPIIALISFNSQKVEVESEDISEEMIKDMQCEEDRKATILSCLHSFIMCSIFMVVMYFVKKHS